MQEIKREFFNRYVELHPEEATSLGLTAGADRLRDHSPDALQAEAAFWACAQRQLAELDEAALTLDERLDRLCMQRLVDFQVHARDWMYLALDWSLYPYTMLEIQRIHAETPEEHEQLARRASCVAAFLEQHQANVERGIREQGRAPDSTLRDFFVSTQLPLAVTTLKELGFSAAASAYERHLSWLSSVQTTDARSIGEQELARRLSTMFGIEAPASELVSAARRDLEQIHEEMIECARLLAPERGVRSMRDVRELALELGQAKVEGDVLEVYRDYVSRAEATVRAQGLFALPDDYAMGVDVLPPSFAATGGAANWPAPLLAANKLGHFLVSLDRDAHPSAWAADLTVHEGIPGHHLQSFIWQRRFGDQEAPVRFLAVHDQVAIPRGYWAPMLNIEGWAVYAEELMRRAGFFSKREELFVLMAHAVRAARVVADLSLAAGEMSQAAVQQFMMDAACLTERHAWLEARRYAQIPLQASTYHLGRKAIERLRDESGELATFHEHFLAFGPVDPHALPPLTDA
ncbi:MAG: DUF885 family protein [Polyangiaceae bacterium]